MITGTNQQDLYHQQVIVVKTYIQVLEAGGWNEQSEKREVKIFQKTTPEGRTILKGVGVIKAPLENIVALLENVEGRAKWDLFYESGKITNRISETLAIGHLKFKGYYTAWPRDFVVLIIKHRLPDGSCLCIAESVEQSDLKEQYGYVRGFLSASGFHIKPIEGAKEPTCQVTYLLQVDLKGWIPTQVSDLVNQYQPLGILGIRKLLTGTIDP